MQQSGRKKEMEALKQHIIDFAATPVPYLVIVLSLLVSTGLLFSGWIKIQPEPFVQESGIVEDEAKFTFSFSCNPGPTQVELASDFFQTVGVASTFSARLLSHTVIAIAERSAPSFKINRREWPREVLFIYFNMVFWTFTVFGVFAAFQESEPSDNPLSLTTLDLARISPARIAAK